MTPTTSPKVPSPAQLLLLELFAKQLFGPAYQVKEQALALPTAARKPRKNA